MEANNKYFVIPAAMIDDPDSHKYTLPIFTFLQCRRGSDYRCMTNFKTMMAICGYDTSSRSNVKRHMPEIRECLFKLRDDGYIFQFCDELGFYPLTDDDVLSMQSGDLFCIEINPLLSDDTSFGFVSMSVFDYGILYEELLRDESGVVYWKALAVYTFILKRMLKRKGYFKEDRDNMNKEIIQENPEFSFMKQKTISTTMGSGFSAGTISKIIKFLEEIRLLHSTDFYYGEKKTSAGKTPNKVGTLFVRHSNLWAVELEAAEKQVEKNYKKYVQKGGQGDI